MVRSYDEESDQGGPNRKIYVPITGFNIVVDLGPGLFSAQIVTRDLEGRSYASERLSEEDQMMFLERVEDVRERIGEIDEELQELGRRRAELIRAKELALNEACGIVESNIEDYQTRRIVFEFIQRPELTPNQIAKELGLRDDAVTRTIGFYLKGAD
jgi:predicted transcriptional regulator